MNQDIIRHLVSKVSTDLVDKLLALLLTYSVEASYIGAGVTQFGVGQVSNDDTLVTFPPVDIGITSHGMFGAIEFDSSWMEAGDSMDWVSWYFCTS